MVASMGFPQNRSILGLAALVVDVVIGMNPFENQQFYVNPANIKEFDGSIATASGDVKANLMEMQKVPSAYWIDNKHKIRGTSTSTLEGVLKDASTKSPPELVVVIWYDLPNRDCDAKASNGEICCTKAADGRCDYLTPSDCADGISEYKSDYADPFVKVLKEYSAKLPIVVVVEPDSLPNLASNSGHPKCGNMATETAYKTGIKYAVEQLATVNPPVSIYIDAAHGGWLGWENNLEKYMNIIKEMDLPVTKIRGFATNVANYQPLGVACPYEPDQGYRNAYCLNNKHQDDECCADPCNTESQWNFGNNELNFATVLTKAANGILGMDAHAIIDTGRNGVVDNRQDCKNWCNPRGAGAGVRSTTNVQAPEIVDAYFWLKTPGESDGCTQTLPDGTQCPRYDSMCGSVDSIGSQPNEPRSPEAGRWFDYQVKQLARNARLSPGPTPAPHPTPRPTNPPSPRPSPTPPSAGSCCWGSCSSNCQGGFCGESEEHCTGNCNGLWCPHSKAPLPTPRPTRPKTPAPSPRPTPQHCEDKNPNCGYWASIGECTKNKAYMSVTCKLSCGDCGDFELFGRNSSLLHV